MEYQFNVFNVTNTASYDIPQDQAKIGQAYVGDYSNYGQVQASKGHEADALPSLYVLPQSTKPPAVRSRPQPSSDQLRTPSVSTAW